MRLLQSLLKSLSSADFYRHGTLQERNQQLRTEKDHIAKHFQAGLKTRIPGFRILGLGPQTSHVTSAMTSAMIEASGVCVVLDSMFGCVVKDLLLVYGREFHTPRTTVR